MSLQGLNINLVTKHFFQLKYYVTCIECCKYYVLPMVAICGHSACKRCCYGKQICSICAIPVAKQDLQLHTSLIEKTNEVKVLIKVFEKMFDMKLDDFFLEISKKSQTEDNPIKNVNDWLTNSQNHFSAPISSKPMQDIQDKLTFDIIDDSTPEKACSQKLLEKNDLNRHKISPNTVRTVNHDKEYSNNSIHHIILKDITKIPEGNYNQEKILTSGNKNNISIQEENNCGAGITKSKSKVKFFKKCFLYEGAKENLLVFDDNTIGTHEIGISIKFGNTIKNIYIKNKENETHLKIYSDKETQTSPRNENIFIHNEDPNSVNQSTKKTDLQFINRGHQKHPVVKSSSTNKNTESAETGTAHFQITESVEKELFDITGNVENKTILKTSECQIPDKMENELNSSPKQNDLDIFECESQKASGVQLLKSSKKISSTILVQKQTNIQKRKQLDNISLHSKCNEDFPSIKKRKFCRENNYKFKTNIDNVLKSGPNIESPPRKCLTLIQEEKIEDMEDIEDVVLGTPFNENSDSDKSVVEETPQKSVSLQKSKLNQSTLCKSNSETNKHLQLLSINKESIASVIDLSDSTNYLAKAIQESMVTVRKKRNKSIETPANIKMFVDEIKLKSTPLARKTLNFTNVNNEPDLERTLSPFAVATTTQEEEFMNEVFEQRSLTSGSKLSTKELNKVAQVKYCVASSCLTASEEAELTDFCKQRGWSYVKNYTKDLTHLVVGVDEDNKSERTTKYIRALASGKWIVSYAWVKKCKQTKTTVKEELFECLDMMGEPSPRRSRLAKRKLFEGITFFCMQPFSLLDVDIFKEILEAAGGRVVSELREIRVVNEKPALLLAEPQHTQEDRFMYFAMEHKIVPVDYEWAIGCLGTYALDSIRESLLCPLSLLPPATNKWPASLIAPDID